MKLFLCILGLASTLAENDLLLKNANDQFTAKMFQEVVKANEGKSVILSGFSVLPPLAQLALASTGPSHDELLNAIGLPDDDTTKQVFLKHNQQLKAVKGVTLRTASRVYIATDAKINKDFAAFTKEVFNSDVKNIDFSKSEQSAQEINAWVEQQTQNKIKNLVNPHALGALTRSVLVNAIYFKGSWKIPFNAKSTVDQDFHVSKSEKVRVPTMRLKDSFNYGESVELDAQLLELLYEGDEASFLIVLPNEIDGLTDLEKKLKDPAVLNKAIGEMSQQEVEVWLPKFKIQTTTMLKDILQKMKVTKIFNPSEAKLDKLLESESNLFVSDAIQKAFIEVNEQGAEAAVANEFSLPASAPAIPVPIKIFNVNKPFYFEVRHINTALFNGAVVNL